MSLQTFASFPTIKIPKHIKGNKNHSLVDLYHLSLQDGIITTWSSSLQLLRGTIMDDKATMIDRNDLLRMKRTNLWVTDATVLLSQNILIISTTSRELNFYDVSSTVYKFLYRLCG